MRAAFVAVLAAIACGGATAPPETANPTPPTQSVARHTLSVAVAGDGRVASVPAGIDCPGTCTATFDEGTSVSLSATPGGASALTTWGGACSGNLCLMTLRADASVTASFDLRRYRIVDLAAPPGVPGYWAGWVTAALSHSGLLVTSLAGYNQGAVYRWNAGSMQMLGPGTPMAVNDSGSIVGYYRGQMLGAFVISPGGVQTSLGPADAVSTAAFSINSSGTIAGWAQFGMNGNTRAGIWVNQQFIDLGAPNGQDSMAFAINDSGVVVGGLMLGGGEHAVRFDGQGRIEDLGTLGGTSSAAAAINSSGAIAGWSHTPTGAGHGFVYSGHQMIDVGDLGNGSETSLVSINDAGVAVGQSTLGFTSTGILWTGSRLVDLNTLVPPGSPRIVRAKGIANDGTIAASVDGTAVLLVPQ